MKPIMESCMAKAPLSRGEIRSGLWPSWGGQQTSREHIKDIYGTMFRSFLCQDNPGACGMEYKSDGTAMTGHLMECQIRTELAAMMND